MKRRRFLFTSFAGALAAASIAAEAQQARRIPRIGVLAGGTPTTDASRVEALRQGLGELGYLEGQTIAIEYRYAEGNFERLPALATELVGLKVDLIVAFAAPETGAAKRATKSIPIVFMSHGDPVGTGHVASLAKPGGNITGISVMQPELSAKRLELLKEAFPSIARVAVLWNAANRAKTGDWLATQEAATALGLTLQSHELGRPDDLTSAFGAMRKQRPDGLMVLMDPLIRTLGTSIVAFVAKERLPAIYGGSVFVEAGGLMGFDINLADTYRSAARYIHDILKGAKPADLAVSQPRKFELFINLKTARALGLTIPEPLVRRADQVIE